jgi:hypothetical protein
MVRRSHVDLAPMSIRDRPITPASPWQNGFAERLIGSIYTSLATAIRWLVEYSPALRRKS